MRANSRVVNELRLGDEGGQAVLDNDTLRLYALLEVTLRRHINNANSSRFEPFRGASSLQDQINRLFNDVFERPGDESNLTTWAPSVDIFETEHELVVKADLPDIDPKDLDIRVEN